MAGQSLRNLLRISLAGGKNLLIDLGAKRLIAAERGVERIGVEVKCFTRP